MAHRESARPNGRSVLRMVIATCLLANAPQAFSQSVSATLRGQVTSAATPAAGATVTATNTETGLTRTVQASANGAYSLAGLPPGTYKIAVSANGQSSNQTVSLQVGQIVSMDLDTVPNQLDSVLVTGARVAETKTSEVSTYVTQKQIESLPQGSRNFLAFADTVPGVQFVQSSNGGTEIRSGAQAANGVNVFIDGVGQKNYVTRGGVGGQGSLSDVPTGSKGTRGNPFPQLAIGEYKVITSNYKAEFDQLSSAAIVAATRSGTNEFRADAFYDHIGSDWRASDPFEAASGQKADSKQQQYGVAVGGPIIQDRMHFFATYEKKKFETPQRVVANYGYVLAPPYASEVGNFPLPFDQDLVFAKLNWLPADGHLIELSVKYRGEEEETFGLNESPRHAILKENKETRIDLRHQWTGTGFLNDIHLTHEDARFNPRPATSGYGIQLTDGSADQFTILTTGASDTYEDRGQTGWGFQDDLTFDTIEWMGQHVIQVGVKYKTVELNRQSQTPYNPYFAYDVNDPSGEPWRVKFGVALPFIDDINVQSKNQQYGLYVQDDWDVTPKLQVNAGIRYDYERTPNYLDYVTPADIVTAINSQDTNSAEGGHPAAPPGQTYAQTLALGGTDINRFISTGSNRKAFDEAFQPRLGFSYDLFDDQRHVVFGGAGRAYDRNVFEYISRETSKGTYPTYEREFNTATNPCVPGVGNCLTWSPTYYTPANLYALVAANPQLGREVFMIDNELKTPYSDQYSLGIRDHVLLWNTEWLTSAAISYVEAKDGIIFQLGNRWPDGQFRTPGTTFGGQPWGKGIPGIGTFITGTNGVGSRATQLLLSAQKPFTEESKWGTTIAYTYTRAKENRQNIANNDETYQFDYANLSDYGWHQSTGVPRHRLVATGIYELPWHLTLSSKLSLATPLYIATFNCAAAPDNEHCTIDPRKPDDTLGFKQFDLAVSWVLPVFERARIGFRADVLNVFNWENVDTRVDYDGSPGNANPLFLQPTAYLQPTRTLKLSVNLHW